MGKPRLWKLWRETKRFGKQIKDVPTEFALKLYFRRAYDAFEAPKIVKTVGQLSLGNEVCIFLVFPKEGLLQSHLAAIEAMHDAGVTPLVVSNLPLAPQHREQLCARAALILERPNIGYDFGGYRDGILSLGDTMTNLDRLWLLNDSAWLLPQQPNWFLQARRNGTNFVAATSNFAVPRVDPDHYREIKWGFSTMHRSFHYASYALGFDNSILKNKLFRRFWKDLQIRNDKTKTVRYGEVGLSRWIKTSGYTHSATAEIDKLDSELAALSGDQLDAVSRQIVVMDNDRLLTVKKHVLSTDPRSASGRAERIAFILTAVGRGAPVYALADYLIRMRSFQFLKKSPLSYGIDPHRCITQCIADMPEPWKTVFMTEATL